MREKGFSRQAQAGGEVPYISRWDIYRFPLYGPAAICGKSIQEALLLNLSQPAPFHSLREQGWSWRSKLWGGSEGRIGISEKMTGTLWGSLGSPFEKQQQPLLFFNFIFKAFRWF